MKKHKFNKITARLFRHFIEHYFQFHEIEVVYWPMTFNNDDGIYFQSARSRDKSFVFYYYSKLEKIDLYTQQIKLKSDEDFECIEICGWRELKQTWYISL